MTTINTSINNSVYAKQFSATPQNNNRKPKSSLSLNNALSKDTVSFGSGEKQFLEKLNELCKGGDYNDHKYQYLMALSHDVNPEDPRIVKAFKDIEKNTQITPALKNILLTQLKDEHLGIGGGIPC